MTQLHIPVEFKINSFDDFTFHLTMAFIVSRVFALLATMCLLAESESTLPLFDIVRPSPQGVEVYSPVKESVNNENAAPS